VTDNSEHFLFILGRCIFSVVEYKYHQNRSKIRNLILSAYHIISPGNLDTVKRFSKFSFDIKSYCKKTTEKLMRLYLTVVVRVLGKAPAARRSSSIIFRNNAETYNLVT
jgi:hypothetical protein